MIHVPAAQRAVRGGLLAMILVAGAVMGAWPTPVQALVVFTVNSTGDAPDLVLTDALCDTSAASGSQCTLRAAIQETNDTPGDDRIIFDIPGGAVVNTIAPATALPPLTEAVTINGYTQAGASVNTLATGNDAVLKIQLNGINAGAGANGIEIQADGSLIRGLVINRFDGAGIAITGSNNRVEGNFVGTGASGAGALSNTDGVSISDGSNNAIGAATRAARNLISGNGTHGVNISGSADNTTVQGNYIGTNKAGSASLGNFSRGVSISGPATATIVGGTVSAARNIISGNGGGIIVSANGNLVQGNFIGTNAAGGAALGNSSDGVLIESDDNTIGGTAAGARNVISGNGDDGVQISALSTGNTVQGNRIGTTSGGAAALGNAQTGVFVSGADGNTIGGTAAGAGNVISGNDLNGVTLNDGASGNIVQGNLIGTKPAGTSALGNANSGVVVVGSPDNTIGGVVTAARNVISANGGTGIVISFAASTGNVVLGNHIGTDVTGNLDLGNDFHGVILSQTSGNTVGARNVISGNAMHGVVLANSGAANSVLGNRIGTNAAGTADLGNDLSGVFITTPNSTVGGTEVAARNVISGNGQHGVEIMGAAADGNVILGNRIGTNQAGTAAVPNDEDGVSVSGGAGNTIGGTQSGARNVISGNTFAGISLIDSANNTAVLGNFIGVTGAGTAALGNGDEGVLVRGDSNDIGGTAAGSRNVISGNRDGVVLEGPGAVANNIEGNFIGTDVTGTAALGNLFHGVSVEGGGQNDVGGSASGAGNLISGNGGGVRIFGSTTENQVMGNLIGTNAAGTAPLSNLSNGVLIDADGNTIGGTASAAGNVISANGDDGIEISPLATGNTIQGNRIGTVADGTAALGNAGLGIVVQVNANDNLIGGTVAGAGNLISGNGTGGIFVSGADRITIQSNRIGTKADGSGDLGNLADGVFITNALNGTSAEDSLIGGTGGANLIAGNSFNGVLLTGLGGSHDVAGNVIRNNDFHGIAVSSDGNTIGGGNVIIANGGDGVAVTENGQGNRIVSNQILANAELGIDLLVPEEAAPGVTANDTDDPDVGANNLQNFPVISSAIRSNATGVTTVMGNLNSNPSQDFTIQFFLVAADPSNHGEAQVFIGALNVTTNANGDRGFAFQTTLLVPGHVITATAMNTTSGNTSEFALNRTVVPGP